MKKTITLMVLIVSTLFSYSQNQTREEFLSNREQTQKELEIAKQSLNKDSIKVAKKNYKPYKKLHMAAAPVYLYNPFLLNAVGISGSFNFNLDKKMQSPQSNITLTGLKSLDNSSWLIQFNAWQYLDGDKWRFNEEISKIKMEMPVALGGGMTTSMHGDVSSNILKAYRKVTDNLYTGPKFEYNNALMTFDAVPIPGTGTEMSIPDSRTEFFGLGWMVDYDTRDNKMYPTKGLYSANVFSFLHHSLGFTSTNPETGQEFVDPVANYFVGHVKKYYSPTNNWNRTFSFRLKYDFRTGDSGSSQWVNQTAYQRGFKSQAVTGNNVLVLNAEYAHFVGNVFKGKIGAAVFTSYGIYGQNGMSPKYDNNVSSGLATGSALTVGLGLRYMLLPAQGIVARADWGMGFLPGSGEDTQNAFNIGIGQYF